MLVAIASSFLILRLLPKYFFQDAISALVTLLHWPSMFRISKHTEENTPLRAHNEEAQAREEHAGGALQFEICSYHVEIT